jgi:hypothetical protein
VGYDVAAFGFDVTFVSAKEGCCTWGSFVKAYTE